MNKLLSRRALVWLTLALSIAAKGAVFTTDTEIRFWETNHDGQDIVISNCTVTIDGVHSFASLRVIGNGTLAHFSATNGLAFPELLLDKPFVLNGQSPTPLPHLNVVGLPVLTDTNGTLIYTNQVDYFTSMGTNGVTSLWRTANSSIPSGATVLVDYAYGVPGGFSISVAGDVEIESGSAIDARGRGYGFALGPGQGWSTGLPPNATGSGAGHGGYGGNSASNAPGGTVYGDILQPATLGSAGGIGNTTASFGGTGGGAVKLIAGGNFILDGAIDASALNATNNRSGGGSGGSVWLSAGTFSGNGSIAANGGAGEPVQGGGGGGGRIALIFATNLFTGSFSAHGGNGFVAGGAGTIYTRNTAQPAGILLVDNAGRAGTNTVLTAPEPFDLTVLNGAQMTLSSPQAIGNLLMASNASIRIKATTLQTFGLSGGAVIDATSFITADGEGHLTEQGPGAGARSQVAGTWYGSGGGHGGRGGSVLVPGAAFPAGGGTYDTTGSANQAGSGGGGNGQVFPGNNGGGVIHFLLAGPLVLDGRISANGSDARGVNAGGGAGGSVRVTCSTLSGSGSITANGGSGNNRGGGGGGGRIIITCSNNIFAGTWTAFGGHGEQRGGAGTVTYPGVVASRNHVLISNGGGTVSNNAVTALGLGAPLIGDLTIEEGARLGLQSQSFAINTLIASNACLITSNNLLRVSNLLVLEAGGSITADGLGYAHDDGPGKGSNGSGGGGYGGYGGQRSGGATYGTLSSPDSGSGGATSSTTNYGGAGGGIVNLQVDGTMQLNGVVSANGGDGGLNSGGGSGGGIILKIGSLSGSGVISANGGNGKGVGGGGGGGRISLFPTNGAFSGTISNVGGVGFGPSGGAGTTFIGTRELIVDNHGRQGTNTSWSSGSYLPMRVDLTVRGGASVLWNDSTQLRNASIESNSWIVMSGVNPPTLSVQSNLTVAPGGGIVADGRGYASDMGPGKGQSVSSTTVFTAGGGGYGGYGGWGNSLSIGGDSYWPLTGPVAAGSGGGSSGFSFGFPGGAGGSYANLVVDGTMVLNGTISANGAPGVVNTGGGSGGGVSINAGTFAGAGTITANGGNGGGSGGGGGGGGRIVVRYRTSNLYFGSYSARGGIGGISGGAGTIYIGQHDTFAMGSIIVDNQGVAGTNTPLSPRDLSTLTIRGNGIVHPLDPYLSISNLTIDATGLLTGNPSHSNLDLVVFGSATIAAGGAIRLDGQGFSKTNGPGGGKTLGVDGSGGGYGGAGGDSANGAAGGVAYGSAEYPIDRGSGGGLGTGPDYGDARGGGALRMQVRYTAMIDGSVSANGWEGIQDDAGGGAGGSIWLTAGTLAGAGTIQANGGNGDLYKGGGGGGGRIAIYGASNLFAGNITADGGDGANPGINGSILMTNNPGLQILSHSPTGVVSNGVSSIDLHFNSAPEPGTVGATDLELATPNGFVPTNLFSVSSLTPSIYRFTFSKETTPGVYTLAAGTDIQDLHGLPMSQVYTGTFAILLPVIQGTIVDTNGQPVSALIVAANTNFSFAITDIDGNYALGFEPGASITVSPGAGGVWKFVPGMRSYTNLTGSISNQNYLAVTTFAPRLAATVEGTNFTMRWHGIPGVGYQVLYSTNLFQWLTYGGWFQGSNNTVEFPVPIGSDPKKFFRVRANN